jgi:asparaginyl-tRNA synthetase
MNWRKIPEGADLRDVDTREPPIARSRSMKRIRVRQALEAESGMDHMTLCGWVRTRRDAKGFSFLELNDGSCLKNIQVIIDEGIPGFETLPDINTGASVKVEGALVESPGKGQKWEVRDQSIE